MLSRNIQADILALLSDGKKRTYQEIADKVEVHRMTAYRHIKSLAYSHNIITFRGGDANGGVQLIPDESVKTNYLNVDELQLIMSKLESLQDSSPNIKKFVKSIAPLIEKRRNILWNQIKNLHH